MTSPSNDPRDLSVLPPSVTVMSGQRYPLSLGSVSRSQRRVLLLPLHRSSPVVQLLVPVGLPGVPSVRLEEVVFWRVLLWVCSCALASVGTFLLSPRPDTCPFHPGQMSVRPSSGLRLRALTGYWGDTTVTEVPWDLRSPSRTKYGGPSSTS